MITFKIKYRNFEMNHEFKSIIAILDPTLHPLHGVFFVTDQTVASVESSVRLDYFIIRQTGLSLQSIDVLTRKRQRECRV